MKHSTKLETLSYNELKEFIHEDIQEFMQDGLDIRQATSRVQVEYAKRIANSELDKLIIYLVLCEEGLKNAYLRDDIKAHALELLKQVNLTRFVHRLGQEEKASLERYIQKVSSLLASSKSQ